MALIDYWRLTRHNWVLLLLSTLGGLALAAGFSFLQPTLYSATSTAYVVAGNSSSIGDALAGSTLAKDKAATYLPLVTSQQVAERIAADLQLDSTAGIADSLTGQVVKESVLFQITATSGSARSARDLADAAIRATAAEVASLETLNSSGKGEASTVIKVVPVQQAATPAERTSPNWKRNLALGPALGLMVGYLIVILRRVMDRRVRSSAEAQELTGVGTLGIIPKADELASSVSLVGDMGPAAEAMRLLRTNLRFVSVDNPPRSIVVTSANPDEGKSTIAAHLAAMLADSGQPTILVDADLRRPTLAKLFGVENPVGLTQVLTGGAQLSDALVPATQPNLQLLLAGRTPPNPSELVGSERMQRLVETISKDHVVIIDAPPLLAVTDAGLLTVASDGALLVIRSGSTFKEQIALCRDTFAKVGGGLLGTVLNLVPANDMGSALYGYGYGSYGKQYYPSEVEEPKRARV